MYENLISFASSLTKFFVELFYKYNKIVQTLQKTHVHTTTKAHIFELLNRKFHTTADMGYNI